MAKTPEGQAMSVREELALYLRMVEAMDGTINAEALEARCYNHTPITVRPIAVGARKAALEVVVDLQQTEGKFLNCITDFVFDLGDQRIVLPFNFEAESFKAHFLYQPPTKFLVEVDLWPRHPK